MAIRDLKHLLPLMASFPCPRTCSPSFAMYLVFVEAEQMIGFRQLVVEQQAVQTECIAQRIAGIRNGQKKRKHTHAK